ncbi:RNase P/RNase MRP complex subunit [Sporothrix curviconia]|uniref:Ribonuclease P protein subunit n=1 Tax=Sporothrix curviconia TaxID=1260050 RepID=A0ABP0ARF9_9PEZI
MAAPARGAVHRLLGRAHSPDTANQIFADKIQHREQFLRPTSPGREDREAASSSAAASLAAAAAASAAAGLAAVGAQGHNGREVRRRSRRIKQEQRQHRARALKPKPLSSRQRRALEKQSQATKTNKKGAVQYATFVPLHQLWLGYIREVLGPNELRTGGASAAAKLTAADFHGALVEVTRSACVGRVGTCGIVIRDTRFVFEVVTPANEVKMVPKEGTFFRIEIPLETNTEDDSKEGKKEDITDSPDMHKMVIEVLGSQFMHRAIDRANRKFKQHFYKEL